MRLNDVGMVVNERVAVVPPFAEDVDRYRLLASPERLVDDRAKNFPA